MKFAKTWDVSLEAMQATLQDLAETARFEGAAEIKQARIAVDAFLKMHGVEKVMHLPPAQRTQFIIFVHHLKRIIL